MSGNKSDIVTDLQQIKISYYINTSKVWALEGVVRSPAVHLYLIDLHSIIKQRKMRLLHFIASSRLVVSRVAQSV